MTDRFLAITKLDNDPVINLVSIMANVVDEYAKNEFNTTEFKVKEPEINWKIGL